MKKSTLLLPIVLLLLVGTGCEKKKETFKSPEYYESHLEEAILRHKECESMNTVKTEAERLDCYGARRAVGNQKLRDMGLLKDKK